MSEPSPSWEPLIDQGDYRFSEIDTEQDEWISTICNGCYAFCGAKVHVVDGTVVSAKGDPYSPNGRGRLCAKGQAILGGLLHCDPYRVTTPLRRTNPKTLHGDPGWEEISWETALDTIETNLRDALPERALMYSVPVTKLCNRYSKSFMAALGARGMNHAGGRYCASAIHTVAGMNSGTWEPRPDYEYADYIIFWGSQHGASAGHCYNSSVRHRQKAWRDGAHVVCIDPVHNMSAEKADEWVPIKPGTDTAFILAMINLYLNEWERYDEGYIREYTNGPYLIRPDGRYVRDAETNKCVVWDTEAGEPKPYDEVSPDDMAIFGDYSLDGTTCKTGLQLIREGVSEYTPELASEECDVPAETVSRIAREFVEHARLGETISIDGHELRHRPATIYYLQGINGHNHGMMGVMGLEILLNILGIRGAVGGMIGSGTQNLSSEAPISPQHQATVHEETGHLAISPPDRGLWPFHEDMYPLETPEEIETYPLSNLPGIAHFPEHMMIGSEDYWGLPECEVVINLGINDIVSYGNTEEYFEIMKEPFTARFAVHLDEAADALADIVLPTTVALESSYNLPWNMQPHAVGTGGFAEPEYGFGVRQPAVEPPGEARPVPEVLLDIVDRVDRIGTNNHAFNEIFGLEAPHRLDPDEKYDWEEMLDMECRSKFGDEYSYDWFKENGPLTWEKEVEEVYWMQFIDHRVSIYFEEFVQIGEELRDLFTSKDIEWDYSDYQGVPQYKECASEHEPDEYEFYLINHRLSFNSGSWTNRIPWIDEINDMDWEAYNVVMHPEAAGRKGISEGDTVVVENPIGNEREGQVTLSEGIRKDCIAAPQAFGRKDRENVDPIGNEKGFRVSDMLMPYHTGPDHWREYTDVYAGTPDMDVKVNVSPGGDSEQ